jgi:hypothetical protein
LVVFADINKLVIDKNIDALQARLDSVIKQFENGSQVTALSLILVKQRQCFFT